ncbi:hypothetical protein VSDG_04035 [Cytospora chrysosperma]|uniref:Acetylserotonin methytransferase-like protein n=1 Tax=Cytospora chrysosperma TaxID=252740 RepID=A0A423W7E5_CYTCH|nr:hypothetical protein VSDG_04035 [Valsa sordida]
MSAGPSQQQGGSFSLFPKERSPSRNQNNTPGRPSIDSVSRDSPPRAGRRTPLERKTSVRDGKKPPAAAAAPAGPTGSPSTAALEPTTDAEERRVTAWPADAWHPDPPTTIQRPAPAVTADSVHRADTAFSAMEAQAPAARPNIDRARSSIAKPPLESEAADGGGGGGGGGRGGGGEGASSGGGPLRSIFPEYDPNLPLSHQNYYPPQSSPTHPANIPAGAISRRLYSPTSAEAPAATDASNNDPLRSPMSAHSPSRTAQQQQQQQQVAAATTTTTTTTTTRVWPPPRVNVQPATPETSSTEQLRNFWKVANGWKAPASEGRVYTLKIAAERDAPVYTLSSKTQPFYRLRLDPTSASAYVSLSRFDPARPYRPPVPAKDGTGGGDSPGGGGGSVGGEQPTKGWQEVISTTLEEASRHHAPEDGLVALLYPSAAARLAVGSQGPGAAAALAAAERECARLVWDDDSGSHFLVHPALAMPFCVTVERNPAWSRTEYTLEHIESPQHLARLTRDGTGMGWLEVDTGIAAKIDAVYLADVAVAALMLVAHADGEFRRVEVFEPPPSVRGDGGQEKRASRISLSLSRLGGRVGTGDRKEKKAARTRLEEFELDLESQASDLKRDPRKKDKDGDKMPGCARAIISLISVTFKCIIWCMTVLFKALTGCIGLVAKCVTSEKL